MAQQAELMPPQTDAIAAKPGAGEALVLMFERLATNPDVDVAKLEKLIEMNERIVRQNARAEFYAAFAEMQPDIPEIDEKGRIVVRGEVQSTYAKNEDIQAKLKPILKRHGFMLSFRTEFTDKTVKIIGVLGHRGGHSEQTEFIAAADVSGNKNAIQALGSTQSYGQRYTTKALLNITSRYAGDGTDDDGQSSEKAKAPDSPAGYDEFMTDMESLADEGFKALNAAWNKSKIEWRNYALKYDKPRWEGIRAKAQKVAS